MGSAALKRGVIILGLISFFTDIASEMLYPVMPVYLSGIGYSAIWIGLIEGFAEAIAGLSKTYFGNLSDLLKRRVVFIRSGYFLSSFSKPMIALFTNPWWILLSRSTDRVGKGVRTGARDALLSSESRKEDRAKVFGFHRGMDTLGAALGPVIALIWLESNPGEYKSLFLFAFIPAIIGVAMTFLLKEPKQEQVKKKKPGLLESFRYWRKGGKSYRKLVAGLLLFVLFNSSDVFLLLKMKSEGVEDKWVLITYIFYNLVYAGLAYPAGVLADKLGVKRIFITGILVFTLVYAGMGFANELWEFFVLFFFYGVYAAMTEGVGKAWITLLVPTDQAGSAIGFMTGMGSVFTLVASTLAGVLWNGFGSSSVFLFTSAGALFTVLYFTLVVKPAQHFQ